jgi:uncharacterized protein with von Willebrand factor type A (vWA) domain
MIFLKTKFFNFFDIFVMQSMQIVFLLDESSSMKSQKRAITAAVNIMIADLQKDEEDKTLLSLFTFNTAVTTRIESHPLQTVQPLTDTDYNPRGGTALYDAIGKTIARFENSDRVMLVIATDGQDHNSRAYDHRSIARMVEARPKWVFFYICETLEGFKEGQLMRMTHTTPVPTAGIAPYIGSVEYRDELRSFSKKLKTSSATEDGM